MPNVDEGGANRLDAKLSALLAIVVDMYLRQTEVAKPKTRSIDKILNDAGLSSSEIARLLGKTDRAVNLQLQKERARKAPKEEGTAE
jgi:SOS response regulatory protein OraA/RecX